MSINPKSSYNHLTLYQNGSVLWTINGPLSADLVAGLCIGIYTMINFMSKESQFRYHATEVIDIDGILIDLSFNSPQHASKLEKSLGDYIIVTQANPSNYLQYNPAGNNYAWWLDNYNLEVNQENKDFTAYNRYIVCQFSTQDFVQGFINICNAYNVDFRNFTLGRPFTYNGTTRIRTYHNIPGYDTEHFTLTPRIPAAIGAFYIDRNEDDPFGEDFE